MCLPTQFRAKIDLSRKKEKKRKDLLCSQRHTTVIAGPTCLIAHLLAPHDRGFSLIIVIQLRGEEDLKHDMDNPPDRQHDSMLVENGGDRSPSTTALARSGSPTTQSFSRSMSTRALAARSLRGEGEAKSKMKTYMLRASTPGDARVDSY